jgi:hypothetical protein
MRTYRFPSLVGRFTPERLQHHSATIDGPAPRSTGLSLDVQTILKTDRRPRGSADRTQEPVFQDLPAIRHKLRLLAAP